MSQEKPRLIVLSDEARHFAELFSNTTGVPIDQAVSEAVLCWWDTLGAMTVIEHKERTAYFAENPDASELDFLKWMGMGRGLAMRDEKFVIPSHPSSS